ncbi:MAG: 16S rRNA (cytosine(1402)-N(4))-methyltransferase RsmH [Candidatus Omnitrophota bacterium]|nr:16S rRNA (cytosine(1402)-N(4))-methyltransferase RsmH [Candidatus Omnitrophota bacterium]
MHLPVMLNEATGSLNLKPGFIVLDATVGGGGHAREILKAIAPGGRLIGLDADASAVETAEAALADFKDSFKLINENFKDLDRILLKENIKNLNAIIFDLGVSSHQIENGSRGFSIKHDARLDMRMDKRLTMTAYDIVNRVKEKDLSDIIERFGEERFHSRIARSIVRERARKPIETTGDLASVIHRAIGPRSGGGKTDSATRTFQAIRIAVNNELEALEEGLKKAVSWLDVGSRICVISFHSLEDRIVKNLFKGYTKLGVLKIVTKKPLRPTDKEAFSNPRSRSAKMRVAERI